MGSIHEKNVKKSCDTATLRTTEQAQNKVPTKYYDIKIQKYTRV